MKRATMTLPDDLVEAVEQYAQSQDAPPTLTKLVQVALRQYLQERGFLRARQPLRITPSKQGSGHRNVSQEHDRHFADRK